jgi:hypothetical protein
MKNIFFSLLLLISTTIIAQKSINNYNYIIIPEKISFLKGVDKYQTSSLTKHLFKQKGYKSFFNSDRLPNDFNTDRCLAMFFELKKISSSFSTKVFFEIKDCNRNLIFKSQVGRSKNKDFKKAYNEAIRNAFKGIEKFNYSYVPMAQSVSNKKNITDKPLVQVSNKKISVVEEDNIALYAQKITNGFQLVNTKPEKVFVVLKTNTSNIFIIKGKNGILYKNGNNWVAEFYENGNLIQKVYQIKF